MLNMNENRQITGNINLENKTVVNMVANVSDEANGYITISASIFDKTMYKNNLEVCESGIAEFNTAVLSRIREVLGVAVVIDEA